MPAFTTPSTATKKMQDSDVYDEIEHAFWEKYVTMAPGTTPPSWCGENGSGNHPGQNIQDATFWQDLQNGVSDLLDDAKDDDNYFLRTTSTPPDYEDDLEDSMDIYDGSADIADLYQEAFGSTLGFRRRVNGSFTTRGIHQANDDVGFWLLEDLQSILKKMLFTKRIVTGSITGYPPYEQWDNTDPRYWKNPTVPVPTYGTWETGFWGIKHTAGSDSETNYDLTRKNINWTTGHDTGSAPGGGEHEEGEMTRGYETRSGGDPQGTNRLSCICRAYYNSNLVARLNVVQYCEKGFVEITGIPTTLSHSAELYGVMDNFHKPETLDHQDPGVALAAGKHRIAYSTQVHSWGGASTVNFAEIGYAGLISGAGRYVSLQSFGSASVATRDYTHLSSPLQFPDYDTDEYDLFGQRRRSYQNHNRPIRADPIPSSNIS